MAFYPFIDGINPTTADASAATFDLDVIYTAFTTLPTGTVSVQANGVTIHTEAVIPGGTHSHIQTITTGFPSAPPAGAYTITVLYSGDANYPPSSSSNSITFTVTGGSGGDPGGGGDGNPVISPTNTGTQARAVVQYRETGSFAGRTREQIENGDLVTAIFQVTSIQMQASGSDRYDANTVAVLIGTVAGETVRQVLAVSLSGGGIASITGFDPTTQWDSAPTLSITRWDGSGSGATFLGY
jgi:hypothetical protein